MERKPPVLNFLSPPFRGTVHFIGRENTWQKLISTFAPDSYQIGLQGQSTSFTDGVGTAALLHCRRRTDWQVELCQHTLNAVVQGS